MASEPLSRLSVTAEQMDAVAALCRLYMSTRVLDIKPGDDMTGYLVVESRKWRWLIDEKGRIAGEGPKEEESRAAF